MKNNDELEQTFNIVYTDAQSWLSQAKLLKLSASVMWNNFIAITPISQTINGITEKMLAFSEAYMLLMGFGFENLIKGIILARDPKSELVKAHGGHGIVPMIKSIIVLNSKELDLLERMQIYLKWAGRYRLPLPKNKQQFINTYGKVSITSIDHKISENLFSKLMKYY